MRSKSDKKPCHPSHPPNGAQWPQIVHLSPKTSVQHTISSIFVPFFVIILFWCTMLHKMLRKLRKILRKLMDLFWLHFSILCKNRVQIQMSLIQNQNNLTKECPIISCDAVSLLKQMNWHFFYSIVFKRS